jgi:hypothetical protein
MRDALVLVSIIFGGIALGVSMPVESPEVAIGSGPETPSSVEVTKPSIEDLLRAIRIVESGDNANAVGDGGNAIGAYQIWKSYWKDAIDHDPSIGGEYLDCYNKDYAERIVRAYMDRWATVDRLGHEPTFEDMSRIHNGGCNIHKKKGTEAWKNTTVYWNKIQKHLGANGIAISLEQSQVVAKRCRRLPFISTS